MAATGQQQFGLLVREEIKESVRLKERQIAFHYQEDVLLIFGYSGKLVDEHLKNQPPQNSLAG